MSSSDRDRIVDRVVALLRIAHSPSSNPHEARVAARRVQELLERYRIDMADAERHAARRGDPRFSADGQDPVRVDHPPLYEGEELPYWKGALAHGLAIRNSVRAWVGSRETEIRVVGRASDVEILVYLFTYLCRQIERCGELWVQSSLDDQSGSTLAVDFKLGVVSGVLAAMDAAARDVRETAPATALAVLRRRDEEVERIFESMGPWEASTCDARVDRRAHAAGYEAGQRIPVFQATRGASAHAQIGG